MKLGVDPFLAVPLCGLAAAIVAFPTAALVFRLRGAYFAVGTWVVAEVFRLSFANIIWLGAGTGTSLTSAMIGYGAWVRDAATLWIAAAIGLGSIVLVIFCSVRGSASRSPRSAIPKWRRVAWASACRA